MAQKNRKNAKNDQKNNRSDILTPDSDSTPKNYLGLECIPHVPVCIPVINRCQHVQIYTGPFSLL